MVNRFFEQPILNSPYEYPACHWELDDQGQPTQQVIEHRRRADFITPIPKPRKRKAPKGQGQMVIDEGMGLSTQEQQYEITANLNEIRRHVDQWRELRNPNDWRVTPETARLLQHWRHHDFSDIRPFFCQVRGGRDGHLADRGRSQVWAGSEEASSTDLPTSIMKPTRSCRAWP